MKMKWAYWGSLNPGHGKVTGVNLTNEGRFYVVKQSSDEREHFTHFPVCEPLPPAILDFVGGEAPKLFYGKTAEEWKQLAKEHKEMKEFIEQKLDTVVKEMRDVDNN